MDYNKNIKHGYNKIKPSDAHATLHAACNHTRIYQINTQLITVISHSFLKIAYTSLISYLLAQYYK